MAHSGYPRECFEGWWASFVCGDRGELGTIRRGVDEKGDPIEIVDALAATLTPRALRYPEDEFAFLRDPELFGGLIDTRFAETYRTALRMMHEGGALATLRRVPGDYQSQFSIGCGQQVMQERCLEAATRAKRKLSDDMRAANRG